MPTKRTYNGLRTRVCCHPVYRDLLFHFPTPPPSSPDFQLICCRDMPSWVYNLLCQDTLFFLSIIRREKALKMQLMGSVATSSALQRKNVNQMQHATSHRLAASRHSCVYSHSEQIRNLQYMAIDGNKYITQ